MATDIYRKPTDANRFLEHSSFHPRHTFRSIIYSQALRYRRIINDEETLTTRLEELKEFFIQSSYPQDLVEEVIKEARKKPRCLSYKSNKTADKAMTPWILTFGQGHEESKAKLPELNRILENSKSWKDEDKENIPTVQLVTRRAPNIKDLLFKRKSIALQTSTVGTMPCTKPNEVKKGRPCQCCKVVSKTSTVTNNNITVKTAGGDCKSRNII